MDSSVNQPSRQDQSAWLDQEFDEFRQLAVSLPSLRETVLQTAELFVERIGAGSKIMFCGNGGSAGDAQHLATELVGRQNYSRGALPGLALTTDTSCLTALGNDDGYETIFRRQVEALGRAGDVLVGISTSGRSRNVIEAFSLCKNIGIFTVAFCGANDSPMQEMADIALPIPSTRTAHIQEGHITIGQMICGLVERQLFPK